MAAQGRATASPVMIPAHAPVGSGAKFPDPTDSAPSNTPHFFFPGFPDISRHFLPRGSFATTELRNKLRTAVSGNVRAVYIQNVCFMQCSLHTPRAGASLVRGRSEAKRASGERITADAARGCRLCLSTVPAGTDAPDGTRWSAPQRACFPYTAAQAPASGDPLDGKF